jgi:hypothetical protein
VMVGCSVRYMGLRGREQWEDGGKLHSEELHD